MVWELSAGRPDSTGKGSNMGIPNISRRYSILVASLSIFLSPALSGSYALAASRGALWDTISNCLDVTALDYCKVCGMPRTESVCPGQTDCEHRLEVWSESKNYIALRDRKMCGCPDGFVHGLAIPHAPVTGVEDPKRPSGIWRFAWEVAQKRIGDDLAIALAVNSARYRSQDQLHVHIVRLKKDARLSLAKLSPVRIGSLDQVWSVAREKAQAQNLDDYGVLVVAHPEGGFLVIIDRESPEKKYTEATCRKYP